MKFFKYLVFLLLSITTFIVYAYPSSQQYIYQGYSQKIYLTAEEACDYPSTVSSSHGMYGATFDHLSAFSGNSATCYYKKKSGSVISMYGVTRLNNPDYVPDPKCPEGQTLQNGQCVNLQCPDVGYPMYVYFDSGTKIPQQRCQAVGDKFCVFKAKPDSIVLNHSGNRQSTVLYNVQKTPVASCTPLDEGQCDKNDPYGSCYQPPNDGCTRLADGSITCPDSATPPTPQATCGGATYCNRPPTGCGTGYVSGSYNGKAICIKSSPSTGTGNGSGTGTGDGSGTGVNTGTGSTNISNTSNSSSTSNTTTTNNSTSGGTGEGGSTGSTATTSTTMTIDFTPVVRAISALSDKMTWVKSEIVNAVSRVEDKLTQTNSKLDTANSKLDSVKSSVDASADKIKTAVEANTAATNGVKGAVDANTNSTANKLNEVVNAINNKPVGGGGGGTTDVKPVVDAIEKQTTDFKDMMKTDSSDFDTSQYEKIGDASDDPRSLNAQSDAAGSLQALSNKLTFSNSACVQDFTVTVPIYGSLTVPISQWCDLLALVKILLHLCTLMVAFKMLDSTVRAI